MSPRPFFASGAYGRSVFAARHARHNKRPSTPERERPVSGAAVASVGLAVCSLMAMDAHGSVMAPALLAASALGIALALDGWRLACGGAQRGALWAVSGGLACLLAFFVWLSRSSR